VGVCKDGSESNTIRLVDVASGRPLPDAPSQTLMDSWTGGAHWLPDSSGFFFTAIEGRATDLEQRVYLHRRSPVPETVRVDVPWVMKNEYRMVVVSGDGRHALALEGISKILPVAFAALGQAHLSWRPFVRSAPGLLAGFLVGDRYVAVTDIG